MKKKKLVISLMFCLLMTATVFFNKCEVRAAGNYWLQVNKGTNVVTVFRSDGTPERAFVCSTGSATPLGTFSTPNKYRWHELDGPSWGQYCTRIHGGVLFHSVWYYQNGNYASQSYREYNKLGTTASHGCVRLTVADSKWIYDNCPLGTTVRIIAGSSANDPLGKPSAIKVPTNVSQGWDPTDPAPGNPYGSRMPSINTSGAVTQITYGTVFQPYAGITARDSLGNDISSSLQYAGNVNTKVLGSYRITYRVTDSLGRTAYADVTYTVADTQKATIKGVKKKLTKEYNSKINLKKNVSAYDATGKKLTKYIKIKVIYPNSKKERTYTKNTLQLKKLGTYRIKYSVKNPNNNLETVVTSKITVRDTKKPKFKGVSAGKTVEYNSKINLKSGVTAKLVSGKKMTSKIVIKMKAPGKTKFIKLKASSYKNYQFKKTGIYTVQYSVTNPYNKKAVATATTVFTVRDTGSPIITGVVASKEMEYNAVWNLLSGINAKLISGTDVTQRMTVAVKEPGVGSYKTLASNAAANYQFNKVGNYTIEYKVSNPEKANAVTVKNMAVIVTDKRMPQIAIGEDKLKIVSVNVPYDVYGKVTAILPDQTSLPVTAQITGVDKDGQKITDIPEITNGQITFGTAGEYTITYTSVNPNNHAMAVTKTFILTVRDLDGSQDDGKRNFESGPQNLENEPQNLENGPQDPNHVPQSSGQEDVQTEDKDGQETL